MVFKNRVEAGQKLAESLKEYKNKKDTIILAIPRGGVVVGFEMAKILNLPLDIVVTKKIGAPQNSEFAVGAIGMDGEVITDKKILASHGISQEYIKTEAERLKELINQKLRDLREDKPLPDLKNKIVILTDDGLATGRTMAVAIDWVKKQKPAKIVLAVPVAPPDTIEGLRPKVDELICLHTPEWFGAVGAFYQDFEQTTDEEAKVLLRKR